ncbi:MAG: transketolase C-terminal domain-containing protein, partial [Candidatus Nanopelagicales bacterium]
PVVAVYATFLNRAFDQVLMDCALHRAGVTFVLDRAGVTGDDGPSHNGVWDMSILGVVPGLRLAAPRDAETLVEALREAIAVDDGPTVIRFPKGAVVDFVPALRRQGVVDVLRDDADPTVLIVGVGVFATLAMEVAIGLHAQGITARVADPRWPLPVPSEVVEMARAVSVVVVLEDNSRSGGIGTAVRSALEDANLNLPTLTFGVPRAFPEHGSRTAVLEDAGLTTQRITRRIVEEVTARLPETGISAER